MRLTRAQILAARDIVVEDVATPEWAPEGTPPEEAAKYTVGIRSLTGTGRGVFIQESLAMKKKEDAGKKADFEIEMLLVAMTAVDDEGKPCFTRDDIKTLGERNAQVISRLAAVASRLAGITPDVKEDTSKNSLPAES